VNWLLELSIFISMAVLGGELCKKIKVSPLIGEIVAGLLLSAVFIFFSFHHDHHLLEVFAELGIIFILFVIGMETNVNQILGVGKAAMSVAFAGVAVPFLFGILLGAYYGWTTPVTLFISSSLVATSITVSARAFIDLNFVKDRSSRVVLGAAIIDDILGLLVLTFVISTVSTGEATIFGKLLYISFFFLLLMPFFWFVVPKVLNRIGTRFGLESRGTLTVALLFFISFAAHWTGLATIIGAFFLGLVLSNSRDENAAHFVHPFYLLLAPLFFFSIGFNVDISAFVTGFGIALVITILAIIGKILGGLLGGIPAGIPFKESLLIGVAMVPRGEVGLIIAGIGKTMGIVDDTLFAATAFMCLATTIIPPLFLPTLIRMVKKQRKGTFKKNESK